MTGSPRGVTDCCVHHTWRTQSEIVDYLSAAWREYIGSPDLAWGYGAKDIELSVPYRDPFGGNEAGVTLDDYEGLRRSLAETGVDTAVLVPGRGMFLPADNNPQMARELTAATNRWTVEHWLAEDDSPFLGSILVPNQEPELAVEEIRRHAGHPRMAQVVIGGNGLGKPFGHPVYRPIFATAAEYGLPVAIHCMGDGLADGLAHSTAGGLSALYGEFRALGAQSLMTHAVSLISQGVFEEYKALRVLLLGGGVTWIAPFLWRLETNFGAFGRESPWLGRTPTEYFVEHIRVGTHKLERPANPELFAKSVGKVESSGALLCYASGLPLRSADSVDDVTHLLPDDWHDAVLRGTAQRLYGARVSLAS